MSKIDSIAVTLLAYPGLVICLHIQHAHQSAWISWGSQDNNQAVPYRTAYKAFCAAIALCE